VGGTDKNTMRLVKWTKSSWCIYHYCLFCWYSFLPPLVHRGLPYSLVYGDRLIHSIPQNASVGESEQCSMPGGSDEFCNHSQLRLHEKEPLVRASVPG
jgi:hypothetical protein